MKIIGGIFVALLLLASVGALSNQSYLAGIIGLISSAALAMYLFKAKK